MKKILFMVAVALLLVSSCKKQEIEYYSGGARVNFYYSALSYTFLGKSAAELPSDTIKCRLYIMGHLADYDRKVTAVVVPDEAGTPEEERHTNATSEDYEILGGIIPANELSGTFYVLVKNNESRGDATLKLRIMISDNGEFKEGLRENNFIDLSWSRAVIPPATWSYMKTYCCDYYSTAMYKAFIEATGLLEFEYEISFEAYTLGRKFGDYVRKYNAEHPDAPLRHDDGEIAGDVIVPKY